MRECWEFIFKFENGKKINFPDRRFFFLFFFSGQSASGYFHLASLTHRTPCATTSACTSALCAWRTWRGRCGRWTRWSTRNAGRRRSRGENLLLLLHHFTPWFPVRYLRWLFFSFTIRQEPLTCQEPALQSRLRDGAKRQLTGMNPNASAAVRSFPPTHRPASELSENNSARH